MKCIMHNELHNEIITICSYRGLIESLTLFFFNINLFTSTYVDNFLLTSFCCYETLIRITLFTSELPPYDNIGFLCLHIISIVLSHCRYPQIKKTTMICTQLIPIFNILTSLNNKQQVRQILGFRITLHVYAFHVGILYSFMVTL